MTEQALGLTETMPYTGPEQTGVLSRMTITSEQIRAARGLLRWEQRDLAQATGLAFQTIQKIEQRPGKLMVRTSSLYAIVEAFEKAGVIFTEPDNGGAGVRWRERK